MRATLVACLFAVACGGQPSGPRLPVHVPPGASFSQVADSLEQRGIVKYGPIFRIYARVTGVANRIKPGTYGFQRGESWSDILEDLRLGRVMTARIVIPEGWSLDRIARRIAEATGLDSLRVLEALTDTAAPRRYGLPGPTLEGYLYPATYEFPLRVALDSVVSRMVSTYKRYWTPARQARADSIDMSEREVVALASIIEKEAKQRSEMGLISSVYHNRLRIGYPLQADPTVQYALGTHHARLLYSHIKEAKDNPYNTYVIRGLPPGPIASPSVLAIDAALRPDSTKFLYFVARPDGSHIFTRSLEEHNRAKVQARAEWSRAQRAPESNGEPR